MKWSRSFRRNEPNGELVSMMSRLGATTSEQLIRIGLDSARTDEDRALACLLLGQLGIREAVPELLKIASSEGATVLTWESLAALGRIGSRRATRPLLKLLRTTRVPIKRQGAVFALSMLSDRRACMPLVRVLQDKLEDETARELAAEALGLLEPSAASTRALIEALTDVSPRLRYSALCALGALREKTAINAVRRLLTDSAVLEGEGSVGSRAAIVAEEIEASILEQGKGCRP